MSVQYKDYYEILGVKRDATDKEIKSAYRKLARQYHPDVNAGKEDRFKEINEAYEVLGDTKKRQMYDNLGSNWRNGQGFDPSSYGGGFGTGTGTGYGGQGFGGFSGGFGQSGFSDFFDILFGQMNMGAGGAASGGYTQFDDLFNQAAGSGGAGHTRTRSQAGGAQSRQAKAVSLDIEQTVYLDLEEVAKGVSKKVKLTHNSQTVTVTIPRGVKHGAKIRLAGQGKQSTRGQKGDVYLIVQFNTHPKFELEGDNLTYEATVPVYDLVLGGEVKIPTLSGSLALTIPAGTPSGKRMRLKGQGLPVKSAQGDLIVRIKALIPAQPSEREKQLYEELRQLNQATEPTR